MSKEMSKSNETQIELPSSQEIGRSRLLMYRKLQTSLNVSPQKNNWGAEYPDSEISTDTFKVLGT